MKTKVEARRFPADAATGAQKRAKSVIHPPLGSPAEGFNVKRFCARFGLARHDLTRLTGYSLRSVDQWATGDAPSAPARKQLREMERLFEALAGVMEIASVGVWLKAPNPAFAGSTPLQVIERGESDRLWRMIYEIQTGEPL